MIINSPARAAASSAGPALAVRGIRVLRGRRSILDVESLEVRPGEVLAVLGPNGAGKSTLVQVMALLERPAEGEVIFDGRPVRGNLLRYRRRMAVVFQEPLLLDTTVEGNVRTGLALRGVPPGEQKRRASAWLERFGIAGLARRSARTLSGGEAQRTSLARAFALQPDVLLLDEPFAALDAPTRQALIDDLDRALSDPSIPRGDPSIPQGDPSIPQGEPSIPQGERTATVFVTHDRSEALRLGDRIVVIIEGRIRQHGTAEDVFSAPADEEVAAFVGVETILPGRIERAQDGLASVAVSGHLVEVASDLPQGADVLFCLRPEDIVLSPRSQLPSGAEKPPLPAPVMSARNHLYATVERVSPAGTQVRVQLDAGFPLVALITRQSREELALEPGSAVVASFKAVAAHLIAHRSS